MWQLFTSKLLNGEEVQKVPKERSKTEQGRDSGQLLFSNQFPSVALKYFDIQYVKAVAYPPWQRGWSRLEALRCFITCQAMSCTPVPVLVKPCFLVFAGRAGRQVALHGEPFVCLSTSLVLKPVSVDVVLCFFSIVYFPTFIWSYLSCPTCITFLERIHKFSFFCFSLI